MSKIENKPIKLERPKLRVYTKEELKKFETLIWRFHEPHTLETGPERGKTINWLNLEKLSLAYGATDKKGAVVLTGFGSETDYKGSTTYWYDRPTRQEQLENLLDQYYWWKNGKNWAEKKRIEDLEETAKSVVEDKTIDSADEIFDRF